MPVELPQRSTRTRPVLISLGLLAVSAGVTFAVLPEREPLPTAKIVGAVAVQAGGPTSAAARIPDPLVLPKKKKKAKPKATESAASPPSSQAVTPASSATVTQPSRSVSAPVQRPVTTTKSSGSSGSSSSAAEAEFGPG